MGSDSSWLIIIVINILMVWCSLVSTTSVAASDAYDPEALNAVFRYYANQTLAEHRRGGSYQVSLPSNYSGMEVSIVRLRSGSLYGRGVNFSFVNIPPRVITLPYVKRLAIVYVNVGDQFSSKYYHVPGYSLLSPVLGFNVYDYSLNSTSISDGNVMLRTMDEPISIHFPYVKEHRNMSGIKCVTFGSNGSVDQFEDMSEMNVCFTRKTGHFSVVVPSMPEKKKKKSERDWKWWVVGFVIGSIGLIGLISTGVFVYMYLKRMKIKAMEKESDKGEPLDTIWVRGDKMPSASMVRTQPVLEREYVP